MASTIPPLANLCEKCRVLEFDDSAWPGAHQAGSEAEGYYLEVPTDREISTWHLELDYSMQDSLPELPRLDHTAKDGCGFCAVLRRSIQKYAKAGFDQVRITLCYCWYLFKEWWAANESPIGLKSLVVQLQWVCIDNNVGHINSSTWLEFGVDSPSSPCAQWLRLESSPLDDALSPENLDMIFNIIRTTTEPTLVYPARLIDIGDDASMLCRLVETSSDATFMQSPNIPYAALSYCWGPPDDSSRQFKTEKDSLNDRLGGFELSEVSPILRDAIIATRALRIQYLWVDAVCVIQDDSEDWEKESSRMSVVYQNAVVTICTPASTSCQEGFLNRDWIMTSIRFQSKINETISGSYIVRLIGEIDERYGAIGDDFIFSVLSSRWSRRGWALQEHELSQRAVIFGRTKIHVITGKVLQSETSKATRLPYLAANGAKYNQLDRNFWDKYDEWLSLVQRYSIRNLANRSDKLPAISGLASWLFGNSSYPYFAGHVILHMDLFWTARPRNLYDPEITIGQLINSLTPPQQYIAPSWSWASGESQILFGARGFQVISGIGPSRIKKECDIDCEISLRGTNPYGAVDNGILTIHGVVIPLVLQVEPFQTPLKPVNKIGGYVVDMYFDWHLFEDIGAFKGLSLVLIGSKKIEEDFIWDDTRIIHWVERGEDRYEAKDGSVVGGIPGHKDLAIVKDKLVYGILPEASPSAGSDRNPQFDEDEGRCAYGIIVYPAPEPGKYLRVGAFFSMPRECGGLGYFRSHPTRTIEII